jgi:hypothetical protein
MPKVKPTVEVWNQDDLQKLNKPCSQKRWKTLQLLFKTISFVLVP